jgi:hypothetical protein
MILELKGKTVLVTGELDGWKRAKIEETLGKWGATMAGAPSKKVDLFVIADKPSAGKVAKARGLGLREVPVKKFVMMLRFGAVEIIEAAPAQGAVLDEAIGELRSVLDGPADAARWAKIVALADGADAERAEETIAYIDGYTSRWAPDPRERWWAMPLADRWHDIKFQQLCGDLRYAPAPWVQEILRGEHHPKHGLLRALSLGGTRANATMAGALLENPHLGALRALDLGRELKLAKGFYKKLGENKHLRALDTLVYTPQEAGTGAALAKGTSLGALRHLHIRRTAGYVSKDEVTDENLTALFEADWLGQIETIEASMNHAEGDHYPPAVSVLGLMAQHAARLTAFKRLILLDTFDLHALLATPLLDQLEELVVAGTWHAPVASGDAPLASLLKRLKARGLPALRRLDLSQFVTQHYRLIDKRYHQPFPIREVLELARGAEVIVLGPDADKKLRALFKDDARTSFV